MARYIDADMFLNHFKQILESELNWCLYNHAKITQTIIKTIENSPTTDVVEVVRCRDCKYFSEIQHCGILGFCEPNEYCSRGERRKEDADA